MDSIERVRAELVVLQNAVVGVEEVDPDMVLEHLVLADVEADAVEGLEAGNAVLGELVVRVGVVRRPVRGDSPSAVVVRDVVVDRVEVVEELKHDP